jgi:hypothetical protein
VDFLVGVIDGMTMCCHLQSKTSKSMLAAVRNFVNLCTKYRWNVSVRCDGEKGFSSLIHELEVPVEVVGPGTHVPPAERKIRVIKERVRAIKATLPYKTSKFLIKWMTLFAVSRLNLLQDQSGHAAIQDVRSPKERFTGVKTDAKTDARIAFGAYAQVYDPNISQINSSQPRTQGALALLPTGNASGSVKFWVISSKQIVTRDKWTELPVPSEVIDAINADATRRGSSTADPSEPEPGVDETSLDAEVSPVQDHVATDDVELSDQNPRGLRLQGWRSPRSPSQRQRSQTPSKRPRLSHKFQTRPDTTYDPGEAYTASPRLRPPRRPLLTSRSRRP